MHRFIYYILVSLLLIPGCEKEEEEPKLPEVKTGSVSSSDYTSATISGSVVSEGSSKIFAQGFLWGESIMSMENKIVCRSSDQKYFSEQIQGLKPKFRYAFAAFAVNNAGISIGETMTFVTKESSLPSIKTYPAGSVSSNSVMVSGDVLNENGDPVIARGFCWSWEFSRPELDHNKNIVGSGSGVFESNITGLASMVEYYIRAYATNSKGTSYGEVIKIETAPALPNAKTIDVKLISPYLATCTMEYSLENRNTITKFGICWNTVSIPTIQDSVLSLTIPQYTNRYDFKMIIDPNTRYFVRAFAINNAGIVYGDTIVFTSWLNKPGPRITDVDGNVYPTVKIGRQIWMAENLRTSKYRNGDEIGTTLISTTDIQSESDPKYQWPPYGNEIKTEEYGRLYTGFAAKDARGICPTDWHLPTVDEWKELHYYLEPNSDLKISEQGEIHWHTGHGGTNLSGFTARALTGRDPNGTFTNYHDFEAFWWTYTDDSQDVTKSYYAPIHIQKLITYPSAIDKKYGFAVRCVKN